MNPLRILDSKEPQDQELIYKAPLFSSYLNNLSIDHFEKVTDKDGAIMARRLAREEGIMVGYSCGSAAAAINQMKDKLKQTCFNSRKNEPLYF